MNTIAFKYHPLTSHRWDDFVTLFGEKGATGGCWCMWWRIPNAEFEAQKGDGNKNAMLNVVERDEVPGILAYDGDSPVGWCAVAPREQYTRIDRSRVLKPIDDKEVWSISCFFIHKKYRRKGLSSGLINASVEFATGKGAKIVEAYPVDTQKDSYPSVFAHTGFFNAFVNSGFKEVKRRSATRPIMRFSV